MNFLLGSKFLLAHSAHRYSVILHDLEARNGGKIPGKCTDYATDVLHYSPRNEPLTTEIENNGSQASGFSKVLHHSLGLLFLWILTC